MKTRQTAKPNLYQTVTDRILTSLKAGIIPWEQPWHARRVLREVLSRVTSAPGNRTVE